MEKRVSVVISVLNRKDEIKKCIDSMINLNYKNYEVIVVDGGSSDGTLEYLKSIAGKNRRLRVFVDTTPGRNPARNTGIKKATGEIIIFVDSDCIVDKNWMKEIVKPFNDPTVGGVIGRTVADRKGIFWYHMENNYLQFIGHNSAYRKEIIKKIGGFDLRFKTAKEDTDLAFRVIKAGYRVVYCRRAKMIHISRRVGPLFRIKNQCTYKYDGLLLSKHPELYRKYFYHNGMPSPLWPSIFSPLLIVIFLYTTIFSKLIALLIIVVYFIITLSKTLLDKNGTLKEKIMFILLIWILPLSRFYYFMKGLLMFRDAK